MFAEAGDPADLILALLRDVVVEVVPAEDERRAIDGLRFGFVETDDVEFPVALPRVDAAAEDDLVADLPAHLLREHVADERALRIVLPRLQLLFGHPHAVADLEAALA